VSTINLDSPTLELFDREWERLAAPGAWFTGAERVEIARISRAARASEPLESAALSPAAVEAAGRVANDPGAITEAWVADLEQRGLDRKAYAELVGVTARLQAVDTLTFAAGHTMRALPDPIDGAPSNEVPDKLKLRRAWVPMTGPAPAADALSSVPAEQSAQLDVASTLYIPGANVADRSFRREIERVQMELVVCRTSLLNECFY